MRISWLSLQELTAARGQFSGQGSQPADWETFFHPQFEAPPVPESIEPANWPLIAEHVARAERITAVLQDQGLVAAKARFGTTGKAIEAATLAAAAHFAEALTISDIAHALRCDIDPYVFYANLLELLVDLHRAVGSDPVPEYERFVQSYQATLANRGGYADRIGAALDGLADLYVSRGYYDQAETLFVRRHQEDQKDLAVALSASRAFLAAGVLASAVAWLDRGAERARTLGRDEMASKLAAKRDVIQRRMS